VAAVEAQLAEDVQAIGDAGGVYHTAPRPVNGRVKVANMYTTLGQRAGGVPSVTPRTVNGLPAVDLTFPGTKPGWAPRVVLQVEVDAGGLITRIYSMMAPRKLQGLDARR
jgi:hypothetical protein